MCLHDHVMSAARSEHFEDDAPCVQCLKDHCVLIVKQEPVKADCPLFFCFTHSWLVNYVNLHFDLFLRQDISTAFLNRYGSVSRF